MGGMVVLVMTAVGLSMVMDRKMKSSSGNSSIQREIKSAQEDLEHLRVFHDERSQLLTSSGSQLVSGSALRTEIRRKSELLGKRQVELEARREALISTIPKLESAFSGYRAEYRRQTWAKAVGEKLGTFAIRGGREYHDAVITRITDVGIEIRHKDGIARVQAPDLDQKFQDRFQWSDEERRARLKEELDNHEKIAQAAKPVEDSPIEPVVSRESVPTKADIDQAKLDHLRAQVIAWKGRVSRLQTEKSDAQAQASYGGQNSVSGSLETWKSKAARIGAELAKARAELSVAKSRLTLVSPNDLLLRQTPQEAADY